MKLVLRAVDAACLAAIATAVLDMGASLWAGRLGLGAFLAGTALLVALALGVALVAAGLGALAPRVDAAVSRRRWLLPAAAAVVLGIPLLEAVVRAAARPGLTLAILLGALAVVAASAYRLAARAPSPARWLAGAVVAEQLAFRAAASVGLVERIDPARPGLPLLLLGAAALGSLAVAELVPDLIPQERRSRGRAAAAALLGAAILLVALGFHPDLYRGAHRAAYLAAFLLLAAGFAWLRLPGGPLPRAGAAALALAGVTWIGLYMKLPSPVPWQLATAARVPREIAGESGLLERAFRRFVDGLRGRPEAEAAPRSPEPAAPPPARLRNVLLLTVDSLRWDHVGWSGAAPAGLTPSIDALAAGATRFRRAYTQGAWTSLALPALLWSRYPRAIRFLPIYEDSQLRLWFSGEIPRDAVIQNQFQSPRDEPSPNLAEVLAPAGFETLAIVNDGATRFLEPRIGLVRGFGAVAQARALAGLGDRTRVAARDELVAAFAETWLAQPRERPFFLWVHFFEPHAPHGAPPGTGQAGYPGEVEYTDRQIGRVLAALRAAGHEASTLVIFTSDHGELFSRADASVGVHGIDLREALVHVPLLVRDPAAAPRDVDEVVALVDVAPTILAALGVAAPPTMQGRDLGPLLAGGALPARPAFLETFYLELGGRRMLHQIGAVLGTDKVVMDLRTFGVAYFDLAADPREDQNLFGAPGGERFAGLAAALIGWYGL